MSRTVRLWFRALGILCGMTGASERYHFHQNIVRAALRLILNIKLILNILLQKFFIRRDCNVSWYY